MSSRSGERAQLELFRALPGDMAPRDAQDLMAYQFFALASRRTTPIDFRSGNVAIRVEGTQEHGIAPRIWDADILIWAASQIVQARDAGLLCPSRLLHATPYEIVRFIGRGVSLRDYQRLKAALDRLQSTTVVTSIREMRRRRLHRFSWINEWKERADTPRHAGRHRANLAGLVLCRRGRRRPGSDYRSGVLPAHWRHRAVVVPPGEQARRQAAGRLAIRLPPAVPKIGQRRTFLGFCLRPARTGGAATVARLSPWHRALAGRCRRIADLPARAVHGTGITCEQPRAIRSKGYRAIRSMPIVLSGVPNARKANIGAGLRLR